MNQKLLLALVALISTVAVLYTHTEQKDDYLEWKKIFGYQWTAEEDAYRRLVYLRNV
jgi:hypothetical protein